MSGKHLGMAPIVTVHAHLKDDPQTKEGESHDLLCLANHTLRSPSDVRRHRQPNLRHGKGNDLEVRPGSAMRRKKPCDSGNSRGNKSSLKE